MQASIKQYMKTSFCTDQDGNWCAMAQATFPTFSFVLSNSLPLHHESAKWLSKFNSLPQRPQLTISMCCTKRFQDRELIQ